MDDVARALRPWAEGEGLQLDASTWERLGALVGLWQRYGAAFNLVGDTRTPALVEHVREGLMAVIAAGRVGAQPGDAWLDIGSGAGIPGLVVAVTWGSVLHVEPRERRAAFLDLALGALTALNSGVVRARWGDATWEKIGSTEKFGELQREFRIVSSKAVMAPEQWLETARQVAPRGIVVAHVTAAFAHVGIPGPVARVEHRDRVVLAVGSPASGVAGP